MNRLLIVLVTALVLVGCTPVQEERSVGIPYPVQTEEDVQNTQQTAEPEQNSTESGTDLSDTQDSAETADSVEAKPDSRERAEYGEDTIIEEPVEQESERARVIEEPEALPEVEVPTFNSTLLNYVTDLNTCKLRETRNVWGDSSKGFPWRAALPHTGTFKVVNVLLDFPNVRAKTDPQRFAGDAKRMEDWSRYWSRGNMIYDVQFKLEWLTLPKDAEYYQCPDCHYSGEWSDNSKVQSDEASLAQIIETIDPYYDMTGVDFINVIVPEEADIKYKVGQYGVKYAYTDEGRIDFGLYFGLGMTDFETRPWRTFWDLAIHEMLHFQGFMGHGPANGAKYGILQNQWDSPVKSMETWHGFQAGWYDEDEVGCLDASNITEPIYGELSNLEEFGEGFEGLIVRLNTEEAIVIEYRTVFGPQLTAYKLNVNGERYRDDMGGVAADERNWWQYIREADGNISIDKSVSYGGVTITNLGKGKFEISR